MNVIPHLSIKQGELDYDHDKGTLSAVSSPNSVSMAILNSSNFSLLMLQVRNLSLGEWSHVPKV